MPARRILPTATGDPPPSLTEAAAHRRAVVLLARRDFTSRQLRDRLIEAGAPPEVADTVVAGLAREGAVDDRRVAAALARRALVIRRRGRLRALRELTEAGIDPETARAAVGETLAAEDEAALLDRAVERYVRGPLADPRHVRRAYATLLRRGFPAGAVRAALSRRARVALPDDLPDPDA
jgi:regulatory protein